MSLSKTRDPAVLDGVLDLVPSDAVGFDPKRMMEEGFCVTIDDDVAYFSGDRILQGHYFFRSRGKKAIENAEKILAVAFEDADVITGLTPIENKAALWMTRRLGFTMLDVLETELGLMQLSMKKDKE